MVGVFATTKGQPGGVGALMHELEAATKSVSGVGSPVASGFTLCESIPAVVARVRDRWDRLWSSRRGRSEIPERLGDGCLGFDRVVVADRDGDVEG